MFAPTVGYTERRRTRADLVGDRSEPRRRLDGLQDPSKRTVICLNGGELFVYEPPFAQREVSMNTPPAARTKALLARLSVAELRALGARYRRTAAQE